MFNHPYALNVPLNTDIYNEEVLSSGEKPTQESYLLEPSTQRFVETVTKGPLNSQGIVADVKRINIQQMMADSKISLDTGTLLIRSKLTDEEIAQWEKLAHKNDHEHRILMDHDALDLPVSV